MLTENTSGVSAKGAFPWASGVCAARLRFFVSAENLRLKLPVVSSATIATVIGRLSLLIISAVALVAKHRKEFALPAEEKQETFWERISDEKIVTSSEVAELRQTIRVHATLLHEPVIAVRREGLVFLMACGTDYVMPSDVFEELMEEDNEKSV